MTEQLQLTTLACVQCGRLWHPCRPQKPKDVPIRIAAQCVGMRRNTAHHPSVRQCLEKMLVETFSNLPTLILERMRCNIALQLTTRLQAKYRGALGIYLLKTLKD